MYSQSELSNSLTSSSLSSLDTRLPINTTASPLSSASTLLAETLLQSTTFGRASEAESAIGLTPRDSLTSAYNLATVQGRSVASGVVGDNNPQDFYRFQLGTTSGLTVTLSGLSTDADLFLIRDFNGNGLLDANEIIASSAALGSSTESIDLSRVSPGSYFALVNQFSGNTSYTLTLTSDAAGNSLSTGRELGAISGSRVLNDFVGSSDPTDTYHFQLDANSHLSLTLNGLSADADLYLIQDFNHNGLVDNGEVLSYSIETGSTPESINLTGLASGDYYIQVNQYQGNTNYQLGITATPTEPGNTLATAANLGILTGQRSVSDFVGDGDPRDFYQFQLNATSTLNLNLSGLSADADLYLIRDLNNNGMIDGNETLSTSVALGTSPESISLFGLSAGNYFVEVAQFSGNTSYTLDLTADAAGGILSTARTIGILHDSQSFRDFVGSTDSSDIYRFSLDTTSNFSLSLSGLSADADVLLIRDFNNNGIVDFGDILASSAASGTSPEAISLNGLAPGTYFVQVAQFSGNTNYDLQLSATPVGGLRMVAGTLAADTFNYTPGYSYTVFSGNGNVDFGVGGYDVLNLSNILSSNVTLNLAGINGTGALFDLGNGTRVFDDITLSNGNQILFEGIDSILFSDRVINLSTVPNDPLFNQQWNLTMMGVQNAWRFTTGSNAVMIGVEDSGLGMNSVGNIHPDLRAPIVVDPNLADDFGDSTSHGTSVEGIISAISNNGIGISGINWNSPIAQVDVIPGNDFGDRTTAQATQELIAQAASRGQRLVINLSLSSTDISPAFEQLVANHQNDVLFVIASGNENASAISYPAELASRYSNVIAVGASWGNQDTSGNAKVPGTRISYPGVAGWGSNYGRGLTLMGPSEVLATRATHSLFGTTFDYNPDFDGTSAATPNVTGVASLVWSANPNLTATQVQQVLSQTAYDLGAPGYDLTYGHGFVNADAAVRRAIALGVGTD